MAVSIIYLIIILVILRKVLKDKKKTVKPKTGRRIPSSCLKISNRRPRLSVGNWYRFRSICRRSAAICSNALSIASATAAVRQNATPQSAP